MKVIKAQAALFAVEMDIINVSAGNPVWDLKAKRIIMRVKPTGFLLNSSVIGDVINRGDVFVVCLSLGTCYAVPGNRKVASIDSTLTWSEK